MDARSALEGLPVEPTGLAFDPEGSAFVSACVRLARHLHAIGLIDKTFGRPIPVLVHELEYYDAIADQAAAANPPGVAADFITWVQSP